MESYEFGVYRLDAGRRTLWRGSEPVPLTAREFDVLFAIVRRLGAPIERYELLGEVWPDNPGIHESNVTTQVRTLRQKLGKDASGQDYVRNISNQGYFIPGVVALPMESDGLSANRGQERESPRGVHNIAVWRVLGAVATVLAIAAAGFFYLSRGSSLTMAPQPKFPDREVSPSFSPDGEELVFHSSGGTQPNNNIYRRAVRPSSSFRLTSGPDDDRNPVWSPGGKLIAFVRNWGPHGAIRLITPRGEDKGKLTDTNDGSVAWFPTSKYIALMDRAPEEDLYGIFLVELGTRRRQTLIPASLRPTSDHILEFSPDGRELAFVNGTEIFLADIDIHAWPPRADNVRPLTHHNAETYGFAWLVDGRTLLFSADRGHGPTLWQTSTSRDSVPQQLEFEGLYALRPTVYMSPAGKPARLAYERYTPRRNIWRIEMSAQRVSHTPTRITPSKGKDEAPQFSANGRKIAFASDRDGGWKVYVCDVDGSNLIQVPSRGSRSGSPRWSPDGRRIVFDSFVDGNRDIYVTEQDFTSIRRLTSEPSDESRPSWSRDGKWIYFGSDRAQSGRHEIWKIRSDGVGQAAQMTRNRGFEAFESLDGRYLYYVKSSDEPGVWRVAVGGGPEVRVVERVSEGHWAIAADGIYFVDFGASQISRTIKYVSFGSPSTAELVYRMEADVTRSSFGFSVTADGRFLLIPLAENQNSEIVIVDNFDAKVVASRLQ